MYFNKLLFHPPSTRYTSQSLQGRIIWIPKQVPKKKQKHNNPKKKSKSFDSKESNSHKEEVCGSNKYLDKASKPDNNDSSSKGTGDEIALDVGREERKSETNARNQDSKQSTPKAS